MIGRLPLWMTLLPLVLGVALWAVLWRGYGAEFEADLAKLLPNGTRIESSGFPYRLEATVAPVQVRHADAALQMEGTAAELQVNRVPWQRDRQVMNLRAPRGEIGLKPLRGATARIAGDTAQASLRTDGNRIARLSVVWENATIQTGLFASPATARQFEAHLRETPAVGDNRTPASPRLPTQVQLVLAGRDMRLGEGAPLAFALDSELTAAAPISSLATWEKGGTAEIRAATLSDATGEVARLSATLTADGTGALQLTGTIETVCPASVRAAVAGSAPVAEQRTRSPERIAVSGTLPGGLVAAARDPAKPPAPVRGQEPPCPKLR